MQTMRDSSRSTAACRRSDRAWPRGAESVRRRLVRVSLAAASVAGGLTACQRRDQQPSAQQQAAVDTAAVKTAIDSLRSAYERGVATGNYDAMATLLADGAVMVPPGGARWDSLFAAASGAPFPPGATIDITPIEVHVLSRDWAYEYGTSTTTYTPKGAKEARKLSDTYIVLFRNTADGWKVYREVASSNSPPKASPGP